MAELSGPQQFILVRLGMFLAHIFSGGNKMIKKLRQALDRKGLVASRQGAWENHRASPATVFGCCRGGDNVSGRYLDFLLALVYLCRFESYKRVPAPFLIDKPLSEPRSLFEPVFVAAPDLIEFGKSTPGTGFKSLPALHNLEVVTSPISGRQSSDSATTHWLRGSCLGMPLRPYVRTTVIGRAENSAASACRDLAPTAKTLPGGRDALRCLELFRCQRQ